RHTRFSRDWSSDVCSSDLKTISSENRFQYFKTTNRELYNSEYKKYSEHGFFDVIFINEKNQVAEGAITNIFINKNGLLYTPPVRSEERRVGKECSSRW